MIMVSEKTNKIVIHDCPGRPRLAKDLAKGLVNRLGIQVQVVAERWKNGQCQVIIGAEQAQQPPYADVWSRLPAWCDGFETAWRQAH